MSKIYPQKFQPTEKHRKDKKGRQYKVRDVLSAKVRGIYYLTKDHVGRLILSEKIGDPGAADLWFLIDVKLKKSKSWRNIPEQLIYQPGTDHFWFATSWTSNLYGMEEKISPRLRNPSGKRHYYGDREKRIFKKAIKDWLVEQNKR